MAYDEGTAERIRECLGAQTPYTEKKMFGGVAFMVRGNMCVGVAGESLMARVGPQQYRDMLARPHVREMDFTGKPMNGYVFVAPEGFAEDAELDFVVQRCLAFNASLPAK
jgi:hypothetical protein